MPACIIAFCKTNLDLLDETAQLHAEATTLAQVSEGQVDVRVIRCLTKCHTCGEVPYVRVGHDLLTRPSIEKLRGVVAARPALMPDPAEPAERASLRPIKATRLSTQGR